MPLPFGIIKKILLHCIDCVLNYTVLCCIVLYFTHTTATITKIDVFVDCIAKVTEVGHKRHYPDAHLVDYVDNLGECIEGCVDSVNCVAIDYIEDVCFEILKQDYNETNLVDAENAVHYYIGDC